MYSSEPSKKSTSSSGPAMKPSIDSAMK